MQDAKPDASGSPSGQGSQLKGLDSFLVVKTKGCVSVEQAEAVNRYLVPVAESMGLAVLVMDDQTDVTVVPTGFDALVHEMRANTASNNRIAASVEALVQAMAEAEGVDPEDVPATLGLNGRPLT